MRTRSQVGAGVLTRPGRSFVTTPYYLRTTWGILYPYTAAFEKFGAASPAVINTLYKDSESITDVEHGLGQINPVYHEKLKYRTGEYSYVTSYGTGDYATVSLYKSVRYQPPLSSSLATISDDAAAVYQRQVRAWRDVQPEFKNGQGFSAVNTLLELKDFKRMPQTLLSLQRNIVNAARNVFRHDSHKTLAELTLFTDYSFRPTVQDAAALSLIVGSASQHLRKFNQQGLTWNTRHYKESLPETNLGAVWNGFREYQKTRGLYTASLRCRYQQAADDALGNFMVYHGLTLSPAQIWEAIPFSFLIDQVYTVGKTLERLSRTAVTRVDVGTFLESLKTETINVRCFPKSASLIHFTGGCESDGVDVAGNYPISYTKRTCYNRFISMPPALGGLPLPEWKGPSIRNLVDDIALLRSGRGWKSDPRRAFNGPSD